MENRGADGGNKEIPFHVFTMIWSRNDCTLDHRDESRRDTKFPESENIFKSEAKEFGMQKKSYLMTKFLLKEMEE